MLGIWSHQTHRKRTRTSSSSISSCCNLSNREWDNLPLTVVFLILDKLLEPADHGRFAAICRHYRSLAKDYNQANRHTRQHNKDLLPPPMLLIRNTADKITTLVSVSEGKSYDNVDLPAPRDWSCYTCRHGGPPRIWNCSACKRGWCNGCGHGWLAEAVECTTEVVTIELQHPLRKPSTSIRLPPLLNRSTPEKVILSEDPALNPDSYVVGVSGLCYMLAFTKARQQHWTYIQLPTPLECVDDAIFYKSQIYAVCEGGKIVSVNFDSNSKNVPEAKLLITETPFPRDSYGRRYLVESTKGDLLYIETVLGENRIGTIDGFKVYKVVFSDGDGSVVKQLLETTSIGDEALFLDDNQAVSFSVSNFPKCKRNSIYYSSNYDHPTGRDYMHTFVFNLEHKTITQPHPLQTMQLVTAHGLWIMPSFYGLC